MIRVNTLGTRIALAMLSIVAIGVFILAIVFFFTFDHMEHKLLEMLDSYANQNLSENKQKSLSSNNDSALIDEHSFTRFTSSDSIPVEFQNLDVGFHHDVKFNGRSYHVAIKEFDGTKKYLLFDITEIETQEHVLGTIIVITTAIVLVIAIWVTYWLSRKVIRPVREFADQVGNLDPNQRNIRLAKQYSDVEVGLIALSFDRYMERLDGFVEREQSFTSTASHELRTPLSIISTSAELLEKTPNLSSASIKYINQIKRNAGEMSNLISALLFLARENLPKNYNPVEHTDIAQLTHSIVDQYRYLEKDKDIKFSVSVDQNFEIEAPRGHVQIVINNLLSNAIHYTQKGDVHIKLNNNKLEVVDSGIGIDDKTIKHVFEPGFRGDDSTGYGFGLYICKRICERYDWDISILRNSDIGSTATISF